MGLGLFSCCTKAMDKDGDGKISREEIVLAGKKIVGHVKNLVTMANASAASIGKIWGVDVSAFNQVSHEFSTALGLADGVLKQITNFPPIPKNLVELKKMLDNDDDGKVSGKEINLFLTKVESAFRAAERYCISHGIDYAPIEKCYKKLGKMIETFEAINVAADTVRAQSPQLSVA
mgnify:CR=1 FL=1